MQNAQDLDLPAFMEGAFTRLPCFRSYIARLQCKQLNEMKFVRLELEMECYWYFATVVRVS